MEAAIVVRGSQQTKSERVNVREGVDVVQGSKGGNKNKVVDSGHCQLVRLVFPRVVGKTRLVLPRLPNGIRPTQTSKLATAGVNNQLGRDAILDELVLTDSYSDV
jgi:hypothetical protein